jgi:hypothetical protein
MDAPGLKTIFTEALERPDGPERAAYLDEACRGDAELRAQVEGLLSDHERIGHLLVVLGLRMNSRQDTPQNPSLLASDPSRVNQIIDLLDASLDGLVLARERRVAGDQSHRLGEPLEIKNGIHRS